MSTCRCHDIEKNIRHRYAGRWGTAACGKFHQLARKYNVGITKTDGRCVCDACGRVICSECVLWGKED